MTQNASVTATTLSDWNTVESVKEIVDRAARAARDDEGAILTCEAMGERFRVEKIIFGDASHPANIDAANQFMMTHDGVGAMITNPIVTVLARNEPE